MLLKHGAEARQFLKAGWGDRHGEAELGALSTGSHGLTLSRGVKQGFTRCELSNTPRAHVPRLGWGRQAGVGWASRQASGGGGPF